MKEKIKAWFDALPEKKKKFAIIVGIIIVLGILTSAAEATERHHVENTYIEQSISNEVNRSALGMIQHNFNLSTNDPQWSLSVGGIGGSQAGSVAIGQKVNKVFISGQLARENGSTGASVSLSGKF